MPPVREQGKNITQAGPSVEMTDIHDIKAPDFLAFNPAWIWYGLFALFGILLIIIVLMLLKRRKKEVTPQKAVPRSPPEETAYGLLKELLPLLESDGRKFYFGLSAIIRGYIQDRFGINALEMTTEELTPEIRALEMDQSLKEGLASLFHAGDPVKFADKTAIRPDMLRHYEFVHDFIGKTTPVPAGPETVGLDSSG